jgi:threonine dehydratase
MIETSEPTPLLSLGSVGAHQRVFLKDESVQPTGTFKDRLAARAVEQGGRNILFGSISYGNTALSFSHACSRTTWARFVAFVPRGFADWSFGPSSSGQCATGADFNAAIQAKGAAVLEVDLSAGILDDSALERLAHEAGLLGDGAFVNVTEGLSEPAYAAIGSEALEQLGEPPDICIVQFGAGILANELRDVFAAASERTVVVPVSTPDPRSLARMLYGPIWTDVGALEADGCAMSRHASPDRTGRIREPYQVYRISEAQVAQGLAIAGALGISAEPSGAAGLGFLDALHTIVPSYDSKTDRVLLVNTGNGIDGLERLSKDLR